MENKKAVIKLAVDLCKDQVNSEFATGTVDEQMEVLRQELIKANGGSDKVNYKSMRHNVALFEIVESILELNDVQGFRENDFFDQFVEYKNIALGDENHFYIGDNSLFTINTIAEGVNGTLRQRINRGKTETIPTSLRVIEVYEELNRLLAGRINIIEFVEKIKDSFAEKRAEAVYHAFSEGLEGVVKPFKETGTITEEKLLDLILHVEAATGGDAIILGTKKALSKVPTAEKSNDAMERKNQLGFFGVFNGTPMMEVKQVHKAGGREFAITDGTIWIVTGNDKPIKFVTEGDALFEQGSAMDNADMTVEILAGERWGIGVVLNQAMGEYKFA